MQNRKQKCLIRSVAWMLSILLMSTVLMPISAFAATGTTGDLEWSYTGGTLKITGSGEMPTYSDDHMAPWYDIAENISRVTVGEGITNIGALAFYGCSKMTTINLPSSVTSIGDRAFKNCTSLSYVNFPNGLQSIGEAAFENCKSLNGIRLPAGLQSIDDYAFWWCSSLTSVTIPSSVSSLGMVVFAYCDKLTSAVIECSVNKVPDWTFYNCKALNTVSLPSTVTAVGENSFHDCDSLKEVYYSGSASAAVLSDIQEEAASATLVKGTFSGTTTVSADQLDPNSSTGSTVVTNITDSGNSHISETTQSEYTFLSSGQEVPLSSLMGDGENGGEINGDVQVDARSKTVIDATVENSDGWTELAEKINQAASDKDTTSVEADVQISGSTVSGEDLGKLAGQNATVEITTDQGDTWRIDTSTIAEDKVTGKTYDLGYTATREEKNKDIDSDKVYKLEFDGDVDFEATVSVNVDKDNANQYATLYEKSGGKYTEKETVVVDNNGNAWFTMDGVSKKTDYYVGINVKGVDTANATIPHTMYEQYNVDDQYTLTDASGTQYVVGERTSRWGITGKQFAIYAGIALGGLVLIVSLLMVTLNKMRRSKMKYEMMAEEDAGSEGYSAKPSGKKGKGAAEKAEELIDEDELRLEVMRELLDEKQKSGK